LGCPTFKLAVKALRGVSQAGIWQVYLKKAIAGQHSIWILRLVFFSSLNPHFNSEKRFPLTHLSFYLTILMKGYPPLFNPISRKLPMERPLKMCPPISQRSEAEVFLKRAKEALASLE
jgi:hypothetical protein